MKNIRKNQDGMGGMWGIVLLVFVLSIALFVGAIAYSAVHIDKEYNTEIHCHVVNARYSQDPAAIKSELLLAKQGMIDAGLTNDTYGAFFSWDKTPDNSMQQQYVQLDQAIAMCDKLQAMDLNSTSYGTTLTNLQNYVYDANGWADSVAYDAYCYNNYPFASVWAVVLAGVLMIIGIILAFVLAAIDY